MSQIDKIIYLPLIFWAILLFILFYFVLLSLFWVMIVVTLKTRVYYLNNLYKFSKAILINTEYQIKQYLLINKFDINFKWLK